MGLGYTHTREGSDSLGYVVLLEGILFAFAESTEPSFDYVNTSSSQPLNVRRLSFLVFKTGYLLMDFCSRCLTTVSVRSRRTEDAVGEDLDLWVLHRNHKIFLCKDPVSQVDFLC